MPLRRATQEEHLHPLTTVPVFPRHGLTIVSVAGGAP
jgi:hypothetical protein